MKNLRAISCWSILAMCLGSVTISCDPGTPSEQAGSRLTSAPTVSADTILPTETSGGLVGAWTQGNGGVTADGAASYAIHVWTPQGRGGVQPSLALAYDSNAGNGPLGVGWNLRGFSQISRCRHTWAQDGDPSGIFFNASDRFCLDGQRLVAIAGTYGGHQTEYRTEHDSFARIISLNSDALGPRSFKVYFKDGRIATYGDEAEPRGATLEGERSAFIEVNGSVVEDRSQRVRVSWSQSKLEDRAGNYLTTAYDVLQASGAYEQLPREIRYTFSSTTPALDAKRGVSFTYELRESGTVPGDAEVLWFAGFKTQRTRRLTGILATVDGVVVRSYRLSYRNDSISGRSLLSSLRECDGAGACKPALVFDWSLRAASPLQAKSTDSFVFNRAAGDVNGDGRDDLLGDVTSGGVVRQWLYLGTALGLAPPIVSPASFAPLPNGGSLLNETYRNLVDLDGDGRAELIRGVRMEGGLQNYAHELYSLSGNSLTLLGATTYTDRVQRAYVADLDGDGIASYVREGATQSFGWGVPPQEGLMIHGDLNSARPTQFIPGLYGRTGNLALKMDESGGMRLLVGASATPDRLMALGLNLAAVPVTANTQATTLADLNGDGLVDLLWVWLPDPVLSPRGTTPEVRVQWNTGNGFTAPTKLFGLPSSWNAESHLRQADLDGDGRHELVLCNRGSDVLVVQAARPQYPTGTRTLTSLPENHGGKVLVLDSNGDGADDLLTDYNLYLSTGPRADLLLKVSAENGMGATDQYDYTPMTDPSVYLPGGPVAHPRVAVKSGMWLVSRHTTSLGNSRNTTTHTYRDGQADLRGHGWLGFASRTMRRLETNAVLTIAYDLNTAFESIPSATFGRTYPNVHLPIREELSTPAPGSNSRVQISATRYETRLGAGPGIVQTFPAETTHETRERGVLLSSSRRLTAFDVYGNLISSRLIADVVANGVATGQAHSRDTVNTYDVRTASWLTGLLQKTVQTDTTPTGRKLSRTTALEFDPIGQLVRTVTEPQTRGTADQQALYLETVYGYDTSGQMVLKMRRASGQERSTLFTYEPVERIFPISIVNPASQSRRFAYHRGLGVLAATDDANGVLTRYRYDGFGRLRTFDGPDARDVSTSYGAANDLYTVTTREAGGHTQTVFYDPGGREIRRQWDGFDGTTLQMTRSYDLVGRLETTSVPHHPGESNVLIEKRQYDPHGRLTSEVQDGEVYRYVREGAVTAVEGGGRWTEYVSDALGRVSEVRGIAATPPTGGSTTMPAASLPRVITRYEYGPFDTLERVVDAKGNQFRGEYDLRGRKTRTIDPDSGTQTLRYDAFDQLIEQVDANNGLTAFTYDVLGRQVTVTSPEGIAQYGWDAAPNGIGQIAWVQSADGISTSFLYDALGRVSSSAWSIGGQSFGLLTTYDEYSRLRGVIYPKIGNAEPLSALRRYTERGDLLSVENAWTGALFWRARSQNARSQTTSEALGNGLVTERRFGQRGHPLGITTKAGSVALQDLAYVSEPRIVERDDRIANTVELFAYDPFDRLGRREVRDATTGAVKQDMVYAYDSIGNLLSRTLQAGTGQSLMLAYGGVGAGPHAVTSSTFGAYTYDARGHQRSGPGRGVNYTSFGLPRRMSGEGLIVDFQYDGFYRRAVERRSDGTEVLSIGGLYERRKIAGQVSHSLSIAGPGRVVAQVFVREQGAAQSQSTVYLHDDALGSTELVTDSAGAVLERRRYEPFGNREEVARTNALSATQVRSGFTGHDSDSLGLVNMKGRIFDPAVGRFLTPDPIASPSFGGEGFNQYAYVLNNPLRFTDPTGYQSVIEPPDDVPATVTPIPGGVTIDFSDNMPFTPPGQEGVDVSVYPEETWGQLPGGGSFGGQSEGSRTFGGGTGTTTSPFSQGFYDDQGSGRAGGGVEQPARSPAPLTERQQAFRDLAMMRDYSNGLMKSAFTGSGTLWERMKRFGEGFLRSPMLPYMIVPSAAVMAEGTAVRAAGAVASQGASEATVSVFHGSIRDGAAILERGLDPARGTAFVSRDIAAAEDALMNHPDAIQGLGRIIESRIPASRFQSSMAPSERSYGGFYPSRLQSTEIPLRTSDQMQLFNEFMVR